jgi:lipopolysaccharide export system permease protein
MVPEKRMKINSIANRYVFREMIPPFGLNILLFTFVFLMAEMLEITNWIINYQVGLTTVLLLIAYSIPYSMIFVIPMSVMMAILLAFLRMSRDNEIIAFKSGGLNLTGFLPAVLLLCLLGFLLTISMTLYGMPWGRSSVKALSIEIATSNIEIGLEERTFNDQFEDVIIYVNKIDSKSNTLHDVFIEDKRHPEAVNTVVAPRGKIKVDSENRVCLFRFFNGTIYRTNLEDRSASSIQFTTYDSKFDFSGAVSEPGSRPKHRKEMTFTELRQYIKEMSPTDRMYYKALLEMHRKFSLPFACFSLGILAFPLGIQGRSAKRSFGLVLGLILFLLYYFLLSAGMALGESGSCPPVIGMWAPNVIIGALGVFLLSLSMREKMLDIQTVVMRFQRLVRRQSRL